MDSPVDPSAAASPAAASVSMSSPASLGFDDIGLLVLRCMGAVLVMTGTGAYLRRRRRQSRQGKAEESLCTTTTSREESSRPLVQETTTTPPKAKKDEEGDDKKLLAFVSQQVAIPALLFTRIILSSASRQSRMSTTSWSDEGVSSSMIEWTVLLWPLYVVTCGLLVGSIAHALSGSSFGHRPLMLASCAFANSTGLPLVLLGVLLQPSSSGDESLHNMGTYFLSLYLLAYPVLQWSVGAWLLERRSPDVNSYAHKMRTPRNSWVPLSSHSTHHYAKCKSTEEHPDTDDCSQAREGEGEGNAEAEEDLETGTVTTITTTTADRTTTVPSFSSTDDSSLLSTACKCGASCLSPPVIGALSGIAVASIPSLRRLMVADVVTETPFSYEASTLKHPPLSWMFDALCRVGQAAVPMNMIVLGMNLSSTFSSVMSSSLSNSNAAPALPRRTIAAVILGKMVGMPLVGIGSVAMLRWCVFADSIPPEIATPLYLVLALVFITPTANNCMVMVELSGTASKEGMATVIGWQYTVAPIVLSMSVALAMAVAT